MACCLTAPSHYLNQCRLKGNEANMSVYLQLRLTDVSYDTGYILTDKLCSTGMWYSASNSSNVNTIIFAYMRRWQHTQANISLLISILCRLGWIAAVWWHVKIFRISWIYHPETRSNRYGIILFKEGFFAIKNCFCSLNCYSYYNQHQQLRQYR